MIANHSYLTRFHFAGATAEACLNSAPLRRYRPRRRLNNLHFQKLLGGAPAQPLTPGVELRRGKTASALR
jgi:hypothetical protein